MDSTIELNCNVQNENLAGSAAITVKNCREPFNRGSDMDPKPKKRKVSLAIIVEIPSTDISKDT